MKNKDTDMPRGFDGCSTCGSRMVLVHRSVCYVAEVGADARLEPLEVACDQESLVKAACYQCGKALDLEAFVSVKLPKVDQRHFSPKENGNG